tara:strand:+ start:30136 stop:33537 length:3402 start_codon:yes stop_codon:yes gene_type:complete
MVRNVLNVVKGISKGIGSLDTSLEGLVKRVQTSPKDNSPLFPYITNEKELEYKVFLGRGEKPGKLTHKQNDKYLDEHFARVNEDPNFGRFSMDVIRQPIDDPKKLKVGKTSQEVDHMPVTLSRINKFGADEVSEAKVQSPFARSTGTGRKNLTTILKVKNNPDDVPLPKLKGRFENFDHKLMMTEGEKIAAGIPAIRVKKSGLKRTTDPLLREKFNPKNEAEMTVLTNQARGLYYKNPENFLTKLNAEDPEIMDNLSSAVKKYSSGVDDLIEEKKRITDNKSKLGKKLYAIAAKYFPNTPTNKLREKLLDFAHIFPFSETGKVNRKSPFLDIGGSGEAMYLSPSAVNQNIQRSLEAAIKNIATALRAKPNQALRNELDRLENLLKKVKALSILTLEGQSPKAFGYGVKGDKFKIPRFKDEEYEELFEYLLEAQPDAKAAELIKSQGLYKYPYAASKYKHPYLGVLVKDGGLIDTDLDDTSTTMEDLPLLDPKESIERQKFNVGGFAALFGTMSKVPKAVARVGDMIKSAGKAEKATDVAVAQAAEDKPAMFLSTVDEIEKMPDVKMGAQQWLGTIKNKPGVSATELDEFGLEALLNNIAKADPKRKLSKTELLETYNKEMPKIDMDIAMAAPVERGAKDLVDMLTKVREKRGYGGSDEALNVTSNDPRLLTALHQPPQDATGMKVREHLLNVMRGQSMDDVNLLAVRYGGQNVDLNTGDKFRPMWENSFPAMYHGANDIIKKDHINVLKNLVPQEDIVKLATAKNIPEEEAFNQLYQALNIFDRNVMTADVPIPFWTKKLLYRLGDMSEGRGFFYKSKKSPAHDGAQFVPGGSGYGELKFYFNFDHGSVRSGEKVYDSGHFSGEKFGRGPLTDSGNAPFGWGRFSERIDENGRKILLMEEIQSDLHQNVAQKGYKYAPRLDKSNVLAEMSDFAAQLDKKMQTLESTRLRKENIMQLPRVERELPENVAELRNIERAMKKLVTDVKTLKKKVEEQKTATGTTGQVHPDAPFKKSENYAKVFLQGLMKMAADKGYDGIGLSTGKMKKAHGGIPKGGDKFYDEIGVKAMKRIAKKSGFKFKDTTIVDGNGFTWEKIPLIEMRDINTGQRIPGQSTIPVYSKGGFVKQNMVRGSNGY